MEDDINSLHENGSSNKSENIITCPKCKRSNPSGYLLCRFCGAHLQQNNPDGKIELEQDNNKPNGIKLRFNTLLSLGQFISFFGWIIVIASVIFIIVGIASINRLGLIVIISATISLVNGILVVAVGQLISCFVSIEHNTYETRMLLKSAQLIQNK